MARIEDARLFSIPTARAASSAAPYRCIHSKENAMPDDPNKTGADRKLISLEQEHEFVRLGPEPGLHPGSVARGRKGGGPIGRRCTPVSEEPQVGVRSHRRARLEVLHALAEFERGCRAFALGMSRLGIPPADPVLRDHRGTRNSVAGRACCRCYVVQESRALAKQPLPTEASDYRELGAQRRLNSRLSLAA